MQKTWIDLLEQGAIQGIENPNEGALGASGGKHTAILGESEASDSGIVSHDELGPLGGIMLHPDLTLLQPWTRQHHRPRNMWYLAETLRVRNGLNLVENLKIGEIVYEYLVRENHNDSVPSETNPFDLRSERELADAPWLVVVPDHNLVRRVAGIGTAADEGEYVATEEHVDEADSAAGAKFAPENLAEGVAVVDAEAMVGAGGEAAGVLVEGEVEEGGIGGGVGRRGCLGWGCFVGIEGH